MSLELVTTLIVLALIDATSFGTLLIPLWLMLAPGRLRPARVVVFLFTVAGFYLCLGTAIMLGVSTWWDGFSGLRKHPQATHVQFWLGAIILVVGALLPGRKKSQTTQVSGRLTRWRNRAASAEGASSVPALMGLAVTAAALEAASMLPYLGAIGLISTAGLSMPSHIAVLAVYCLLMCVPALMLLALRLVMSSRVEPLLRTISTWMERQSGDMVAWILAIIGFVIARDAVVSGGGPGWSWLGG